MRNLPRDTAQQEAAGQSRSRAEPLLWPDLHLCRSCLGLEHSEKHGTLICTNCLGGKARSMPGGSVLPQRTRIPVQTTCGEMLRGRSWSQLPRQGGTAPSRHATYCPFFPTANTNHFLLVERQDGDPKPVSAEMGLKSCNLLATGLVYIPWRDFKKLLQLTPSWRDADCYAG